MLEGVGDAEHQEGEAEEQERGGVRLLELQRLDRIVDRDRDGPGLPRDVSPEHQDHAELPDGVGEGEHQTGQHAGPGGAKGDPEEGDEAGLAEAPGGLDEAAIDRGEGRGEGTHRKREIEDDRAEENALVGEGEERSGRLLVEPPERTARAGGDEKVEADHRRRKDQGERDQCVDNVAPPPPRRGEPVGEGHADQKEDRGGRCGEPHREADRLPIHRYFSPGMKPYLSSTALPAGATMKSRSAIAAA